MAGVRDPAFWKRFSTAIHQDEEHASQHVSKGKEQSDAAAHKSDWLARQQAKRSRRAYVCCGFWMVFGLLVLGVVATLIWLVNSGVLNNIHIGNSAEDPSQMPNPNGGKMGE